MKRFQSRASADGTILLNLGCGPIAHPEWNNLDCVAASPQVVACNVIEGIPFEDASVDAVYSSHFVEHLSSNEARKVLSDTFRVLKPGGVVRMVIPDFEFNVRLYLRCLEEVQNADSPRAFERYEWAFLNLIDQLVRDRSGGMMTEFFLREHHDPDFIRSSIAGPEYGGLRAVTQTPGHTPRTAGRLFKQAARVTFRLLREARPIAMLREARFRRGGEIHKWMYDWFSIQRLLRALGYVDPVRLDAHTSGILGFERFRLDIDVTGQVRKPNSLFAEAKKPWGARS